jgi:hypothetical protein
VEAEVDDAADDAADEAEAAVEAEEEVERRNQTLNDADLWDLRAIAGPTENARIQAQSATPKRKATSIPPPSPTCKEEANTAALGSDKKGPHLAS